MMCSLLPALLESYNEGHSLLRAATRFTSNQGATFDLSQRWFQH